MTNPPFKVVKQNVIVERTSRRLLHEAPSALQLLHNVPLDQYLWFRCGGPAEHLAHLRTREHVMVLAHQLGTDKPFVLGLGSNLIVRDGGIEGWVVKLGGSFQGIHHPRQWIEDLVNGNHSQYRASKHGDIDKLYEGLVSGGSSLVVGAATPNRQVAKSFQQNGIGGLEFLSSIPGSIGGGVAMNAGCYGREFADVIEWVEAWDWASHTWRILSRDQLSMSYRKCELGSLMVTAACLKGYPKDPVTIENEMRIMQASREASQPVRERTGGSTFKNPVQSLKAWEWIDRAGCRGIRVGGAQISNLHCNFMINSGPATSNDLETLGELVREKVHDSFGVGLEWEIQRVGAFT